MTELEPLLRSHFSAEADAVTDLPGLLGPVTVRRAGRRRRRRRLGAGAVALGALAALAAAVAVPLALHGGPPAALAVSGRPLSAPPGMRAEVWQGIAFDVPAAWNDVEAQTCRPSTTRSVVRPQGPPPPKGVYNCPSIGETSDFVVLSTAADPLGVGGGTTTPTTLAGLPATVTRMSADFVEIRIPRARALFVIDADPAVAAAIIASLRRA